MEWQRRRDVAEDRTKEVKDSQSPVLFPVYSAEVAIFVYNMYEVRPSATTIVVSVGRNNLH